MVAGIGSKEAICLFCADQFRTTPRLIRPSAPGWAFGIRLSSGCFTIQSATLDETATRMILERDASTFVAITYALGQLQETRPTPLQGL